VRGATSNPDAQSTRSSDSCPPRHLRPARSQGKITINTKATKRILIVDDQPHVLDVLRDIIARFQHGHAYEITTARSVADALDILQRERFDLILLDMVMPGIGDPLLRRQGLDLLKRVRDHGVNAPVLMMSGDYESRKEAEALIEGAFGYLHKPFNLRELDHLVARAIASAARG
jgi:DNA-binding NtrC family response regulator